MFPEVAEAFKCMYSQRVNTFMTFKQQYSDALLLYICFEESISAIHYQTLYVKLESLSGAWVENPLKPINSVGTVTYEY